LHSVFKYLFSNGIMYIPSDLENSSQTADKMTLCSWADSKVSDSDAIQSIYSLSR
jgi:hypothetical protein